MSRFTKKFTVTLISVVVGFAVAFGGTMIFNKLTKPDYKFVTTYTSKDINSRLLEKKPFKTVTGTGTIKLPLGSELASSQSTNVLLSAMIPKINKDEAFAPYLTVGNFKLDNDIDQNIFRKDTVNNVIEQPINVAGISNYKKGLIAKYNNGNHKVLVFELTFENKGKTLHTMTAAMVENDYAYFATITSDPKFEEKNRDRLLSAILTFDIKGL